MENTNIVDRGLIFQERFKELVGSSTQEEVAKKVNTSRQNVGNWLKGKSRPDIFALSEISKGFGVSTDYLLGLTDVKSNDTTVQGICEYTGLSEEAVKNLSFCKEVYFATAGFDRQARMNLVFPLDFLLTSKGLKDFLFSLTKVCYLCYNNLFPVSPDEPLCERLNDIIKDNIAQYCQENNLRVIKKYELANYELYEAQHELANIFKELLNHSFNDELTNK